MKGKEIRRGFEETKKERKMEKVRKCRGKARKNGRDNGGK